MSGDPMSGDPVTGDPAAALVEAARELDRRGLNSGTAGNLSLRAAEGMLITPTGIATAALAPERIVAMSLDGRWSGRWRPSSEWAMHAAIYRAVPDARAVVHAHPDAAVALSCLRQDLPAFHYMVAGFGGDSVRCAAYAPFGSDALAAAAVAALEERSACLLANHGMICYGADLAKAVAGAVKLETLVRQYLLARGAGPVVLLGPDEMAEVRQRYRSYGRQEAPEAGG